MLVVSNTSPLTNLAAIDRFGLLRDLFGEIHIAEGVWQELNAGGRPQVGSREVGAADWVHRHTAVNRPLIDTLRRDLYLGEAETVALALELKADLVLMDEREGRHATTRLGLVPLGVLGILLRAKRKGLLPEVRPLVDDLRRQAGFFVADQLYRDFLVKAEEGR